MGVALSHYAVPCFFFLLLVSEESADSIGGVATPLCGNGLAVGAAFV